MGEIKWKRDGSEVTALLPRVLPKGKMLHLVGWEKLPIDPNSGRCPRLKPSAGLTSRMCFYGEHPIHILPAKVCIKVELGCAYNGRWNERCPSYSTPSPSSHCLGDWWHWVERSCSTVAWKRISVDATVCRWFFFRRWQWGCAQHGKNESVCQVQLFLLIGISRPTSPCYHTGELIPGKMFFSFSASSARWRPPFFPSLKGLVVPVLPRLSRYCLLPISLLGL